MNRQVVLEIGNTHAKAGLIEISSLPFKTFSSWGKRSSADKFIPSTSTDIPSNFDENLHLRALKDNQLNDFDFLIELIEYSMEKELEIPKESFEQVQLTLILPSAIVAVQLPLRSKLIKSIYDRLRVSAVFLGEVACMAALGSAHGTALVLNFDSEGVEIAAVNDFSLVTTAVNYFSFSKPLDFKKELPKISNLNELLSSFDPSNDLSKETEVKFTLDNRIIPLNIFHQACQNLFANQRNSQGLNVLDVIESVLDRIDPDRRSITLNHLIVNGIFPLPFPLLVSCLHSILVSSSLMAVSDYPADTQPASLTFRSIPDYYMEIKESGRQSIAWFGASLAGKYAHSDSKTFIIPSKTQQQP